MAVDLHVVTRASQGDAAAWRAIVSELGPAVRDYLVATGVSGVDDELSTVFEETAITLADLASDGTDPDELAALVFDVAHRRLADRDPAVRSDPEGQAGVLRTVAGLDDDQVAYVLGADPGQVRSWGRPPGSPADS
jgi:hypothetical protein